jgi:hypothetical protein
LRSATKVGSPGVRPSGGGVASTVNTFAAAADEVVAMKSN